ncbi:MAG: hypothetical protein QOJ90_3071 [Actinomycetota bacterium]|jgi:hypothetical protein|nr:hypothetical protein [Actinomycetota bacterium]
MSCRPAFRAGVALVAVAVSAVLTVTPLSVGVAAAVNGCTGVTVVVQSGSAPNVRCASGDPSSGLAALAATGHSVEYVRNQPGFVCKIDGQPADVSCGRPPPTNAYWSYWYRTACSTTWRYSSTGAGQRNPKRGETEGWRFGSGSQPPAYSTTTGCATAPAPKPTPAKTTHAATKQATQPPRANVVVSAAATATTSRPSVAAPVVGQPTAAQSLAGAATPSETATSPSPTASVAAPLADPQTGSGSSGWRLAGVAVAAALVAALAGAAVLRARGSRSG